VDETQLNAWLVAARAVHFGACLLAFGIVAFNQWIAAPALIKDASFATERWHRSVRRMVGSSLALALVSGAGWFTLNAISMSGLAPREALQPDVLRIVLTDTHFGKLWELRGLLWIVSLIALAIPRFALRPSPLTPSLLAAAVRPSWDRPPLQAATALGVDSTRFRRNSILLIGTGALAASLAWAGHGTEGSAPNIHLAADALHILIGGLWPAGLLPFVLLLTHLRRHTRPEKWHAIASATRRFSATSLAGVIVLAGTGVINSLFLIGSLSDLVTTPYGKTLTAKILVFLAMVALGALNLLRWKPRLTSASDDRTAHAAGRLRVNVALELALGAIVLLLVGLLGLLPPAIDAIAHVRHHH
jgi:copper resistance protein D